MLNQPNRFAYVVPPHFLKDGVRYYTHDEYEAETARDRGHMLTRQKERLLEYMDRERWGSVRTPAKPSSRSNQFFFQGNNTVNFNAFPTPFPEPEEDPEEDPRGNFPWAWMALLALLLTGLVVYLVNIIATFFRTAPSAVVILTVICVVQFLLLAGFGFAVYRTRRKTREEENSPFV